MKKLLIQAALFAAYVPFAGWSAWMTATSFHLNVLSAMPFGLVFFMVFIVALLAGYFLNRAIREPFKPNPSRFRFCSYLLAFIFFWGVSFMTNVHYNYILSYGYGNLSKQVQSCISYLNTNIDNNDAVFDTRRDEAKQLLEQLIRNKTEEFRYRLNDTRDNKNGFGEDCISALNAIETIFASDANIYKDAHKYIIFDEESDQGDQKRDKYKDKTYLQTKYEKRILDCLNKRYEIIDRYFESQKGNNNKLKEALALALKIEKEGLPQIEKEKDFESYSDCYNKNVKELLKKMPDAYFSTTKNFKKNEKGEEEFEGYLVYPSERMFDWLTVWGDWWNDNLPEDENFKSGMPTALMWDVVAFILISML